MKIIKSFLIIISIVFFANTTNAQTTLFSETFDEAVGAVAGMSAEGISWSATCPGCLTGDIYEVTATGGFQGNDTNGPATFSATGIDATGCYLVTYSFDFNATEYDGGDGVGEAECASDCAGCSGLPADASSGGCNNCWDYLYAELDLGASSDAVVLLGVDCDIPNIGSTTSAPSCASPYDVNGDLIPGNDASNITLNLVVSNWATAEQITFDNIILTCYTEAEATTAGLTAPANCFAPPVVAACNISAEDVIETACNDNETANDGADDYFTFTIDTTQDDVTFTGYTFDGTALGLTAIEAGTYGVAGYTSGNVVIGGNAGSTVMLTLVDDTDSNCTTTVEVLVPSTCAAGCDANITNFPANN